MFSWTVEASRSSQWYQPASYKCFEFLFCLRDVNDLCFKAEVEIGCYLSHRRKPANFRLRSATRQSVRCSDSSLTLVRALKLSELKCQKINCSKSTPSTLQESQWQRSSDAMAVDTGFSLKELLKLFWKGAGHEFTLITVFRVLNWKLLASKR